MEITFSQHSFSGHDTFPFRYAWLKKAVDAVHDDGNVFQKEEAVSILGVGKNMVRSIRHWAAAAGVIEEDRTDPTSRGGAVRVSSLGDRLFGEEGWDPYLEDTATLWLLHWQLATNHRRCTTWFWAFNCFHEPEFTRETFLAALERWSGNLGGKPVAANSVKRDADCFFRTYVASRGNKGGVIEDTLDCPLVDLELIRPSPDGRSYQFNRGPKPSLPDAVLLFAIISFWDQFSPHAAELSLFDLCRQSGTPGLVFKLDEDSIAERLERLERATRGAMQYGETAGLRQIYRRERVEPLAALEAAFPAPKSGGLFG